MERNTVERAIKAEMSKLGWFMSESSPPVGKKSKARQSKARREKGKSRQGKAKAVQLSFSPAF